MRILMVSNLWPPEVVGGAEQYASALSDHLCAAGHEVHVLTLGVEGPDVVARGGSMAVPDPGDPIAARLQAAGLPRGRSVQPARWSRAR